MNIDSPSLPPLPPSGGSSAPAPAPVAQRLKTEAAATATPGRATAQLRSTHGDFDAARVAGIRERLRDGSYTPNLERVADGMLAHLKDLSRKE